MTRIDEPRVRLQVNTVIDADTSGLSSWVWIPFWVEWRHRKESSRENQLGCEHE